MKKSILKHTDTFRNIGMLEIYRTIYKDIILRYIYKYLKINSNI